MSHTLETGTDKPPINQESAIPLYLRQEILEVYNCFYNKVNIPEPQLSEAEFWRNMLYPILLRLKRNGKAFGIGYDDSR